MNQEAENIRLEIYKALEEEIDDSAYCAYDSLYDVYHIHGMYYQGDSVPTVVDRANGFLTDSISLMVEELK